MNLRRPTVSLFIISLLVVSSIAPLAFSQSPNPKRTIDGFNVTSTADQWNWEEKFRAVPAGIGARTSPGAHKRAAHRRYEGM